MRQKRTFFLICLMGLMASKGLAQSNTYEKSCIDQFLKMCDEIRAYSSDTQLAEVFYSDNAKSAGVGPSSGTYKMKDSVKMNRIISKYFILLKLDGSGTSGKNDVEKSVAEVKELCNFFVAKGTEYISNYSIKPIHFSKNKFMLDGLDTFKINHSFVLFDKAQPEKEIMYLFFLPPVNDTMGPVPRILAWKMTLAYDKYFLWIYWARWEPKLFSEVCMGRKRQ